MPALPPYITEPIWEQFCALLPEREVDHPLGCHRPRIPDRTVLTGRYSRSWYRFWYSAAPTGGSPTGRARPPRCGTGARSG
jgi:hypothetical protein